MKHLDQQGMNTRNNNIITVQKICFNILLYIMAKLLDSIIFSSFFQTIIFLQTVSPIHNATIRGHSKGLGRPPNYYTYYLPCERSTALLAVNQY
jgi:hypothetical protein